MTAPRRKEPEPRRARAVRTYSATAMTPGLRRDLRLSDALFINIGTILASAAFVVPAYIVADTGSAFGAAAVWTFAGAISLCGAFAIAELSALFPRAGGEYVYLEEAYHPLVGFLYGWSLFAVIQTASIAAVAVICVEYAAHFVAMSPSTRIIAVLGLILALTAWNCRSVRQSADTQNFTTAAKLVMAAAVIGLCVLFGQQSPGEIAASRIPVEGSAAARWGAAIVAALWAYDGWISITFVGGEVRRPARLPAPGDLGKPAASDRYLPRAQTSHT